VDLFARAWIVRAGVDLFRSLDLRGRQAIRAVAGLAQRHGRIELTSSDVADDAVFEPVERIARVERGLVQDVVLRRRDEARRIFMCRLPDPHLAERVTG